jgi:regulator of sigma D
MVDYLSRVHFEVFEKLYQLETFVSQLTSKSRLEELTKRVELSTDHFLDFNDKYLATDDLAALSSDLSILGEELAKRFEIEDEVIATIRQAIDMSSED